MNKAEIGVGIKGDTSDIKKKVGSLGSELKSSMSGLTGMIAGAFSIGAIVSFGRKLLQTSDDMQTAANTFGMTLENMIAMKSAMAESGIGADRFMRIFAKLNSSMSEANQGVKTYTDAFAMMNISQKELAGTGGDIVRTMELLSQKYGEAADKTDFLAGVSKAFGDRIGPQLVEVFNRIRTEGLDKFKEGAQSSAKGIEELAKASDTIEGVFNKIIMWSANAVGAISRVAEAMGRLSEERPKMDWFTKYSGLGIYQNLMESIGEQFWKSESIGPMDFSSRHKSGAGSASGAGNAKAASDRLAAIWNPDEAARKEKETAQKKMDKQLKLDEASSAKLDEMYAAEDKLAEDYAKKRKDITGPNDTALMGPSRVDSLQAIGGLIGNAGGQGDQSARAAERQEKIQKDISDLVRETNTKLDELSSKLDGIVEA